MSSNIRDQILARQQQAGGQTVNITDLVSDFIRKNDANTVKKVQLLTKEEADFLMKNTQIQNLSSELLNKFGSTPETIVRFKDWMTKQEKLFNGCIVFEYCPHSMGISLHAFNVLTNEKIDLTVY